MTGFRTFLFFAFVFASVFTVAETYRLNASYFIRNSPDFTSRDKNKVGVLTKGSSFRVLNSIRMSNGAEALEIRVVGLSPSSHMKPSKSYWIYKSAAADFIKLNNDKRETQANSVDMPCNDCSQPVLAPTNNAVDLADVSKTITRQDNTPPSSPESLDEKIKKYSESPAVEYAVSSALNRKSSNSRGRCYHSVKSALRSHAKGQAALIPSHFSDEAALNARKSLKKFGFINLLEIEPYKTQISKPSLAPKGAVLVYSSGIPCRNSQIPDCGHVEIKTGRKGADAYVSDYSDATGINETPASLKYGTRYKLVGVMIKPMDD